MGYDKFEGLNSIADEYKRAVAESLLKNEIGGVGTSTTGYELSYAGTGTSGWSFGGQQLDLSERPEAMAIIKDIYIKQYGASSWTSTLEASLKAKNNPTSLTSQQITMINTALSSSYGKTALNQSFISEITNLTNYMDKVEIELQKVNPNLTLSLGEKLMLIDYHNQYNLDLNSTSSSALINKMKSYITTNGDITPEAIADLFRTTGYYQNLIDKTPQENRITNAYNAAKALDSSNLQQTTYLENGKPTTLFYSQDSDLLMYGNTIDNPNKISFTNKDGSYEVWEKINGSFAQTIKIDNSFINKNYNLTNLMDEQRNIFDFKSNGLINNTYYTNISKTIKNYLISSNPTSNYSNLVNSGYFDNSYLNPIKIGAFYESSTSQIDNSSSIAKKTFKLLNSSNQTISKNQLNDLDVNKDGKLSGNEIGTLKTWKDLNEDGIVQTGEITSLTETIYQKDYDTFTKGNSIFQNPTTPTQAVKQNVSYITPTSNYRAVSIPTSNYSTVVKTVSVPTVPYSNFDTLRNSDNVYVINYIQKINWSVNQVKINNSNRTYMIGTNGNDSFDYRYYAQYSSWFNVNILRNFLGGAGDDQVGGSNYADNIWGGIGNDTLYGYDGDDNVYGEEGNDVLLGQNGNDKLFGGAGNDVMYGHIGIDTLYGGIGNDELHGNEGNDLIVGESGDDLVFAEVGNDTIYGGDGNDTLLGFTASNDAKQTLLAGETDDDLILGGNGNDRVFAGLGNDRVYGESGIDTIYAGEGNDYVDGGTENDILLGENGNDTIFGGTGNDEIQGGNGNDILSGDAGNDKIFGQTGNDTIYGGDGDDLIHGFTASNEVKQTLLAGETDNDLIYGGNGADTILAGLGDDRVYGESGIDTIYGGDGNDYIDGGSENDILLGENGNDTIFGGAGNDELQGGYGNDILSGDIGNDKIFGQTGDDTIYGGEGDDILVGFTASNESKQTLLAGETDNDLIYGGNGADTIYGKFGDDRLFGEAGKDFIAGGDGNDYIDGGIDDDALLGENGNDTIFGGTGNDEIQGGDGIDTLVGDDGNDKIFGQTGNDTIYGGEGDDILIGFTAINEEKQTLLAGETDNDLIYAGNGNDFISGGLGNDTLFGEAGNDEIQSGNGADMLYGGVGNDRLFGQEGNDIIYGGDGDDLIIGFRGFNESQTLTIGQSDDDFLYGGAGNDTILGGLGNDYIDGGAGADTMEGGAGNDFFIVNSINDSILEFENEGYDVVVSSTNYLLNKNIEELRLVDGYNINATGNALDNVLVGNSSDNILDGVTGKDTMIGGLGNDLYYVDNIADNIVENTNEGKDTIYSTISYTIGNNVENIQLLDFSKAERGIVDGVNTLVYGYPKMYELDYMQGDAVENFQGTCALTSIANLLTQNKTPTSESQVVNVAINNNWAITNPAAPSYIKGGSNYMDQQNILNSYGISNDLLVGYNPNAIANLIQSGRGVILALNAGYLWDEASQVGTGTVNHVVTVTGAVYKESDGALTGFYIADSGRGKVTDMTRYISLEKFEEAVNVPHAYAIYTNEPIKLWNENVNGYGNSADNIIVGNRANNELYGYAGNDSLEGARGDDSIFGGAGNDTYVFDLGDGTDTIFDESGADKILFTNSVSSNDILFSYKEKDLVINYGNDEVIITNQKNSNNSIEKVELSNGNYISNNDIENIIQQMNAYAQNNGIDMTNTQDVRNNENLMTIVHNSWNVA